MKGSGSVIGVIEMINKIDSGGGGGALFDGEDEKALAHCALKVADGLGTQFSDVVTLAGKFAGKAIFVGNHSDSKAKIDTAPPKSSSVRAGSSHKSGYTSPQPPGSSSMSSNSMSSSHK